MCCVLQSSCGKPSFGVIIRNRSKVVVDTLFSPRAFCWGKYKILGIFFGWRVLSDKCNKSCKLLKFACTYPNSCDNYEDLSWSLLLDSFGDTYWKARNTNGETKY